jgi:hypothetical protein
MHFICTPMWTKFYSYKKWVLQNPGDLRWHLYGFLHQIIDGKDPNNFLVLIELYLGMIQKKSKKEIKLV